MVTARNQRGPAEIAWPLARAPLVLVVDDDEVIRRLIAANLMLEGFNVARRQAGRMPGQGVGYRAGHHHAGRDDVAHGW